MKISQFLSLLLTETEEKLLVDFLTKSEKKRHFLFFYYLINNKLEDAIQLFQNLALEKTQTNLLFYLLKACINRSHPFLAETLKNRYSFLNQVPINPQNEIPIEKTNETPFKILEEIKEKIQEDGENIRNDRENYSFLEEDEERGKSGFKSRNKYDFNFSSKV